MRNIYIFGITKDKIQICKVKDLLEQSFNNTRCWIDLVDDPQSQSSACENKKRIYQANEYKIAIFVTSQESQWPEEVLRILSFFMKTETPLYAVIDGQNPIDTSQIKWFKGSSPLNDENSLLTFVQQYLNAGVKIITNCSNTIRLTPPIELKIPAKDPQQLDVQEEKSIEELVILRRKLREKLMKAEQRVEVDCNCDLDLSEIIECQDLSCDSFGESTEGLSEFSSTQNTISGNLVAHNNSFFKRCISALKNLSGNTSKKHVYSCVYAPSQAKVGSGVIIQVFLHLPTEIAEVDRSAKVVDSSSIKRNSKQLSILLQKGEVVDVELSIPSISLDRASKSMTWNGHYESVEFAINIPEGCKSDSLLSTVTLYKQHIPIAEMSFKIDLVSNPSKASAEIFGYIFRRAFISYSHKDIAIVEPIANQLRKNGIEYFLDKHTLVSGDKYRELIKEWIELSDLFILCWSKNSEESKEVEKERHMALEIANRKGSSLRICPFVFKPKAPIPTDMVDVYNFTEI